MSTYYIQGRVMAINEVDALHQILLRVQFRGYAAMARRVTELHYPTYMQDVQREYEYHVEVTESDIQK